jgi:hypothetical protein
VYVFGLILVLLRLLLAVAVIGFAALTLRELLNGQWLNAGLALGATLLVAVPTRWDLAIRLMEWVSGQPKAARD